LSFETLQLGTGIYTVSDLAEILKIEKSRARYWFNEYVRNILPTITNHVYNFNQTQGLFVNFKSLLQLYVFEELKKKGIKKKDILNAYRTLSKMYSTPYPFATNKVLTAGKDILLELDHNSLINANQSMQYNLVEVLIPYLDKIEFDISGNAIKFFPFGADNCVVVDPEVQFGSPTINGTRIDIKTIFEMFEAGDSKKFIAKIYNLSLKQVNDAIEFSNAA